jgi:hypothetical protein
MTPKNNILIIEFSNYEIKNIERQLVNNSISIPYFIANTGVEALCMIKGTNGYKKIDPEPKIILFSIYESEVDLINFVNQLNLEAICTNTRIFALVDSAEERARVKRLRLNLAGCIVKPVVFNKYINSSSIDNLDLYMELVRS